MAEINKPDYNYLWSSGGAIVAPSNVKIQTGWTAEVPPFQWENWSQNRQDQAISHILQKGISVWSATGEYYFTTSGERSYVQGSDGNIYVAVADSVGQNPFLDINNTYWKRAFTSTSPPIGTASAVRMTVAIASASATMAADEIIVGTALGGDTFRLNSYSKIVNLSTNGAGGLDTGSSPLNGYVALYAIYSPSTGLVSILATNATSVGQGVVYGGVAMPSGYTFSALLTVVPTNGSGQFKVCAVRDRRVHTILNTAVTGSSNVALTPVSLSNSVPPNALSVFGELQVAVTSPAALTLTIVSDATLIGQQNVSFTTTSATGGGTTGNYDNVPLTTPQTFSMITTTTGAAHTWTVYVSGYNV